MNPTRRVGRFTKHETAELRRMFEEGYLTMLLGKMADGFTEDGGSGYLPFLDQRYI